MRIFQAMRLRQIPGCFMLRISRQTDQVLYTRFSSDETLKYLKLSSLSESVRKKINVFYQSILRQNFFHKFDQHSHETMKSSYFKEGTSSRSI